MPVDAQPHAEGTVEVRMPLLAVGAEIVYGPEAIVHPVGSMPGLHRAHFATCPNADEWRQS